MNYEAKSIRTFQSIIEENKQLRILADAVRHKLSDCPYYRSCVTDVDKCVMCKDKGICQALSAWEGGVA